MLRAVTKFAFHDADTDFLARIIAGMSGESARILARKSVSVSASWNASLRERSHYTNSAQHNWTGTTVQGPDLQTFLRLS